MSDILHQDLIEMWGLAAIGELPADPWDLYVDLFVSNSTFSCDLDPTTLTLCSAPGYAPIHAAYSGWTSDLSECIWTATYGPGYFVMTGPGAPVQTIYGHIVHNGIALAVGATAWGLTWATPYVIPAGGATIEITLHLTVQECAEAALGGRRARPATRVRVAPPQGSRRKRPPK